jgi:hypothetical protein
MKSVIFYLAHLIVFVAASEDAYNYDYDDKELFKCLNIDDIGNYYVIKKECICSYGSFECSDQILKTVPLERALWERVPFLSQTMTCMWYSDRGNYYTAYTKCKCTYDKDIDAYHFVCKDIKEPKVRII